MKRIGTTPFIILLGGCVIAMLFKLMHWPFASILNLLFLSSLSCFSFFLAVTTGLDATLSDKQRTLRLGALLGFSTFAIGALFHIQNWPFSLILILIGGVSAIVFGLFLYISGSKNQEEKPDSNVVILSLIAFLVVSLAFGISFNKREELKSIAADWHTFSAENEQCIAAKDLETNLKKSIIKENIADTSMATSRREDIRLLRLEVLTLIRGIHTTLITYHGYSSEEAATLNIDRLGNNLIFTDISNHYLIGQNPMQPEGEAKRLKEKLRELEHALGSLETIDSQYKDKEKNGVMMSWESAEFWDVSLAQVLTKLKKMELELCQKSL